MSAVDRWLRSLTDDSVAMAANNILEICEGYMKPCGLRIERVVINKFNFDGEKTLTLTVRIEIDDKRVH